MTAAVWGTQQLPPEPRLLEMHAGTHIVASAQGGNLEYCVAVQFTGCEPRTIFNRAHNPTTAFLGLFLTFKHKI